MRKILFFLVMMMVGSFAWGQAPNIQWAKCYGGTKQEQGEHIIQTKDGGYIFCGWSNSNDGDVSGNHGSDAWIVKTTATGNIQWQKPYGGSEIDLAVTIIQTIDNGYIFTGYTRSNNGDVSGLHGSAPYIDAWVVKIDSLGNIQWQKPLGGTKDDYLYSILQTSDSGYILLGGTNSNDGDVTGLHGNFPRHDEWVVKINKN